MLISFSEILPNSPYERTAASRKAPQVVYWYNNTHLNQARGMVTVKLRPNMEDPLSEDQTTVDASPAAEAQAAEEIADDQSYGAPLSPADIKHNIIVMLLIDCLFTLGTEEMSRAAGPLYKYLGASNTMVGLMAATQITSLLGIFLSPFISRRFPYKKVYVLITHIPYLLPWGLIGFGLIMSRHFGVSKEWLLHYVLIMNCMTGLFAGFVSLPHQEYVAACIPMSHRGRLNGYSNAAGAIVSMIGTGIAGWILLVLPEPTSYGWMYIMTWAICQGGYIVALFARERRTPIERTPKPWSKTMILNAVKDGPYMRVIGLYFVYSVFFLTVMMFVNLYGFKELRMIPAAAAGLGIVQKTAMLLTCTFVGLYVDKISAKRALSIFPLGLVAMFTPLIFWHSQYAVYMAVALWVVPNVGFAASFNCLISGIPKPEDRAGHFTFQILAMNVAVSLGSITNGFLFDKLGYRPMFAVLAGLALILIPVSKILLSPLSEKAEDYS